MSPGQGPGWAQRIGVPEVLAPDGPSVPGTAGRVAALREKWATRLWDGAGSGSDTASAQCLCPAGLCFLLTRGHLSNGKHNLGSGSVVTVAELRPASLFYHSRHRNSSSASRQGGKRDVMSLSCCPPPPREPLHALWMEIPQLPAQPPKQMPGATESTTNPSNSTSVVPISQTGELRLTKGQ